MGAEPSAALTILRIPPDLGVAGAGAADAEGVSAAADGEGDAADGLPEACGVALGEGLAVVLEPQANRDKDNKATSNKVNAFFIYNPP
jgi:hypothetical protein